MDGLGFSLHSGNAQKRCAPIRLVRGGPNERSDHRTLEAKEGCMTPEQVILIQQSFAKVAPIAEPAAVLFYGRLFEIAPEVKPLFRGDMTEQGRKLMATLAVVVNGLSNLESILPAASALARKHVAYGVKAEHYGPVGVALIWTLERGLGAEWTPELAAAWTAAYTTLSGYMVSEAYGRREAAE
jgi:hemoglobin-like flavoprotein